MGGGDFHGDFPRGVAEGPRKTQEPTLNAGKPKRRPNKNETTDGKKTPGATKNKKATRDTKPPQQNNVQRGQTKKDTPDTRKDPVDRAPILDDWAPFPFRRRRRNLAEFAEP